MSRISLAAVAGLAIASSAHTAFSFTLNFPGPFTLAGGSGVILHFNAFGTPSSFAWSFDWADPGDSSWASDMAITITDPNSNSFQIAGYDTFAPDYVPSYDGPQSGPAGTYGDSVDLNGALSGSGVWTLQLFNDWSGDPNPNVVSNLTAQLLLPPSPGPLGVAGVAGVAALRRRR